MMQGGWADSIFFGDFCSVDGLRDVVIGYQLVILIDTVFHHRFFPLVHVLISV